MKIGVLGGGQLGKMMGDSCNKNFKKHTIKFLDPSRDACVSRNFKVEPIQFNNYKGVSDFCKNIDVLTAETEHINVNTVKTALKYNKNLIMHPKPETFELIQNKLYQKEFLYHNEIDVPRFFRINDNIDIDYARLKFGLPMVLKSITGGYDGKGVYLYTHEEDLEAAKQSFGGYNNMFAEEKISFEREISVIVIKDTNNNLYNYPVSTNININGICVLTETPSDLDEITYNNAVEISRKTVSLFRGAGTYCVEMFLKSNGNILVNEVAPRPHNTGHYTIDACNNSQFDNHIRAITGDSILDTSMNVEKCFMLNILGKTEDRDFKRTYRFLEEVQKYHDNDECIIHWYGKTNNSYRRKLGHINILGTNESSEKLLEHVLSKDVY